jgi:hypothetical protein
MFYVLFLCVILCGLVETCGLSFTTPTQILGFMVRLPNLIGPINIKIKFGVEAMNFISNFGFYEWL